MNIIKKLFLGVLFYSFIILNVYSDELQDFAEELSEITEDFSKLSPAKLDDTKVIDESLQELNKAVEYVQQNLESGNAEMALKGATFASKTLGDITVDVPKSYKSNMDNADMSKLGKDGMTEINKVTKALAAKKEKDKAELINGMVDINDAGFNVFEVSKNINDLGIKTIEVDFDVKSREEMKNWTKEDWQQAWNGGVISDDGKQVLTDKEISVKLASLNNQLGLVNEKNQLIKEKEDLRKKTQTQLNQLKDQLNDLEKQKGGVLSNIFGNKNNLDKQIKEKQKEIKEANTLISQFNKDITNIDSQLNNIQGQTASLNTINSDIQNLSNSGKTLAAKGKQIKSQLDKNNERIAQLQDALQTRQITARDAKTTYTSWEHNNFTYSGRKLFDSTLANLAKEKNISVDLGKITDQQRIDYYDKYQATFDAVELWPQTSSKLFNIDSLKSDGTAKGWINRQKKVLSLEKEYLAQERGILKNKEEIDIKVAENEKINAEFASIQSQIQQNESLVNIKKNELTAVEVSINKISLDDPRKNKLEKLQAEKITEISKIESQVTGLNKEVEVNNNKLNTTLSSITSLQNGVLDANTKLNELNQQLISAASKKNIVSAKSRADIDKEMESLETFGHIFIDSWDAPDEIVEAQLEYALKTPEILLSADPMKQATFDLERYGSLAGVSKDVIEKGKAAYLNKDFETKKDVWTQVANGLSKNKDLEFNVSATEIDNLLKEEEIEIELVNLVRSNPTGVNFDINAAPIRWNKGAVAPEALKDDIASKFDEIINSGDYAETLKNYEVAEKTIKETKEWIDQAQKTMTEQNLWTNKEIRVEYDKKFQEYMNAHTTKRNLSYEVATIRTDAQFQAKDAIWTENNKVVEAQIKAVEDLSNIIDAKLSEIPSLDTKQANRVKSIVSKLSPNSGRLVIDPSIDSTAAEIKAALYDRDGSTLAAYNIANDTRGKSFAYDAFSGTGNLRTLKDSYNQNKTNIEIAAEVKSTMDGTYSSDYINGYMNAKYDREQLEREFDLSLLSPQEKKEFEDSLNEFYSKDDKRAVKKVEDEIKSIENNIKSIEAEKSNFNKDIENLNKEVAQIYKEEEKIQGQIASLQGDITKTTETFKNKEAAITENINQISAIDFQLSQLQSEKSKLENKISTGNKELETKLAEVAKVEADLKNVDTVVSGNAAEIDTKINEINKNAEALAQTTVSLDKELNALKDEIKELEKGRPALEKEKAALNAKLEKLNNTKAELATAQAKNFGLDVNEKSVKAIPKTKKTSIIAVKGTGLVRVIDSSQLVNKAEKFKDPVSKYSVNSRIFTVGAIKPSALLAQTSAGEVQVLKTYQYETAKTNREKARESWNAQISAGASKEVLAAEEAKWEAAKQVEIAAANSVREAGRTASSLTNQSFSSLGDLKKTFAKEQAARAAQLKTLESLRSTPGMNKWDVRSAEAAIKNAKEEMKNARLAFESMKSKASYFSVLNQQAQKVAALQASIQQTASDIAQGAGQGLSQQQISTSLTVEETAKITKDVSALQAAGATSSQASALQAAQTAKMEARKNWDAAMASGSKAAQQAAEDAFMAARAAETVAGREVAAAAAAAASASKSVSQVAAEVAQAAQAAAETANATAAVQDAARDAQQAAIDALWTVEAAANNTFDVFRATAAIRQIEAEMHGNAFSYKGASSYEDAMKAIDDMEKSGKPVHGQDPNKKGPCGKASC